MATSGAEVEVECAAEAGNPPPGLRWWLGGERWEAGVTTAEDLEDGTTVSRVRIPVSQADHGKAVRCEVVHEALTRSLEAETSLDIQCESTLHSALQQPDTKHEHPDTGCGSECILSGAIIITANAPIFPANK